MAKELPEYTRLRGGSPGLPPELRAEEAGAAFEARRAAAQGRLESPPWRPAETKPIFTTLATGTGLVTIGPSLVVFSSAVRAEDYRKTLLGAGPRTKLLVSSAAQLLGLLGDAARAGLRSFALDRCPRCTSFNAFELAAMKKPGDLLQLWAIVRAGNEARGELYQGFALEAARAGRLEIARDVALESIAHVGFEAPRAHLLLGMIAIALDDRALLDEAKRSLAFLEDHARKKRLAELEKTRAVDFRARELEP